jgi:hypothetical protein
LVIRKLEGLIKKLLGKEFQPNYFLKEKLVDIVHNAVDRLRDGSW